MVFIMVLYGNHDIAMALSSLYQAMTVNGFFNAAPAVAYRLMNE